MVVRCITTPLVVQRHIDPHETRQFNDIFTAFGITPQADVQVSFDTPELTLFGYASEVRNDTGDAIFVVGSSPNS